MAIMFFLQLSVNYVAVFFQKNISFFLYFPTKYDSYSLLFTYFIINSYHAYCRILFFCVCVVYDHLHGAT